MRILLWSVNTDQNWTLITSTNLKNSCHVKLNNNSIVYKFSKGEDWFYYLRLLWPFPSCFYHMLFFLIFLDTLVLFTFLVLVYFSLIFENFLFSGN